MLSGREPTQLGLGCAVEIDTRTGTARASVKIPVPAGRDGFGPGLTLTYTSSGANSEVGASWSLGFAGAIGLYANKRLASVDGSDRYQYGGAELVPWRANGAIRRRTEGDWQVTMFRVRRGMPALRVEEWLHVPTARRHFRSRDAGNVLTIYGARPGAAARLADPEDELRTYTWLPELQLDPRGNAIWFDYVAENDDAIDAAAPFEPRGANAQRYLKQIRYGNADPLVLSDDVLAGKLPAMRWHFAVVLDYGDHADPPAVMPDRPWPARRDAFSSRRTGFEIRTRRLCRRIHAFHDFLELGPNPTLVGSLELVHDEAEAGSVLRELRYTGFRTDAPARTVPPLVFAYAPAVTFESLSEVAPTSLVNAPAGLAKRDASLVDLFGEGLNGILTETSTAWYYKANEGGGEFAGATTVLAKPQTRLREFGFGDWNGDGNPDLAHLAGRLAGTYTLDRDLQTWGGFQTLPSLAHVEALGNRAHWVDLDGDGRMDIVIPQPSGLTWYPAQADGGFGLPRTLIGPTRGEPLPGSGATPQLDLFFADMTGDGMVDLVQLQNGRAVYWPSLGNGQFGPAVVMDGAPVIAAEGELDASRIRFVDLDGSGTADLVYIGRGEITTWINATGNRFVPGPRLTGLPVMDSSCDVSIRDLLGDGRQCLVWSTPLPGQATPVAYLPLSEPIPARTLLQIDDSMGSVTTLSYSSSTSHYLRDARAGRPWRTKLPHPYLVTDERRVHDEVTGGETITTIAYHDGYYDSRARELRGFAIVDTYDTKRLDDVALPASMVRSWFHLGTEMWGRLEDCYAGDTVPPLAPHVLDLDGVADADTILDGLATLAGQPLRREVWAVGGTAPFEIEQSQPRLRCIDPGTGNSDAVWSALPCETLTATYEQEANDPRIVHQITIATDEWDLATRTAVVAYARRGAIEAESQAFGSAVVEIVTRTSVDTDARFELGLALDSRTVQLAGIGEQGPGLTTRSRLLAADVAAAIAAPGPFRAALPAATATPLARLLAWQRGRYWDDTRSAILPAGQIGTLALAHHQEVACFDQQLIDGVLAGRIDAAGLAGLGFVAADDLWWTLGPTIEYTPATRFSQRIASHRSDGSSVRIELDPHELCIAANVDAFGNRLVVEIDYHLVTGWRATDPNGTVSEVRRDALGVVVAQSTYGKVGDQPWGTAPLVSQPPPAADLTGFFADPATALGTAAAVWFYDLTATPALIASISRDQLPSDGSGTTPPQASYQLAVEYHDGFKRVLQRKVRVESGPAIQRDASGAVVVDSGGRPVAAPASTRWLASGHVVYDAKQQKIRSYEPFFTTSAAYEGDAILQQLGAPTITLYDAISRPVGHQLPNGTYTRVTHRAWSLEEADANDSVADSTYRTLREGLPADDPERLALAQAMLHAGTTHLSFRDPLGRTTAVVERGGSTAADRRTETKLDITGKVLSVTDPRGLIAVSYDHDMRGAQLHSRSCDAGDAWALSDAFGRGRWQWSARNYAVETSYDLADRPVAVDVTGGDGATPMNQRVQTWTYGESLAAADAVARNAYGRSVISRSAAGELEIDRYDPGGATLSLTRRLPATFDSTPDWNHAVPLGDSFVELNRYDARGRLRTTTLSDGSTRDVEYVESGGYARVTVTTPLGAVTIYDNASYNEHGQLLGCTLGNGVTLAHTYDRDTFRLVEQVASRPGRIYQDLEYTYDPVGNITRIADAASLIPNVAVAPVRSYQYDAHYRLTSEIGRVHQALLQTDATPFADGTIKQTRHIALNNGAAVEKCTRLYTYDASGNVTQLRHAGTTNSWTTNMWVSPTSNRSLPDAPSDPEAQFDQSGNMRGFTHLRSLVWDWCGTLNRAVIISRPSGTDDDERYFYSGDRNRVMKRATRVVTGDIVEVTEKLYLGDCERKRILRGDTVILERWTVRAGSATPGAEIHRWTVDQLARETDDITRQRVHYRVGSHQGSATIELDETGELLSYEEFFAYGGTAFIAGDDVRAISRKDYRYVGKECDDATGLYAYGLRYYAPWIARWISTDPGGFVDDLNLYQFVFGNPVGHTDLDGAQTGVISNVKVAAGDVDAAVKQWNNSYGLDHGRMITAAHWEPADQSFHIDSEIRLSPDQVAAKQMQQAMVGAMSASTNHTGGSGSSFADEATRVMAGAHGDGTADLSGDLKKTGSKTPGGFDEDTYAGHDNIGPEGMGLDGKGPGGGKLGKGANAHGDSPGSEGGNGDVKGFGTGSHEGKPGQTYVPGGGDNGKQTESFGTNAGLNGSSGAPGVHGKKGGKPGGKEGGKDKENKPGSKTGDPNGTDKKTTPGNDAAGSLPPADHLGAGTNPFLAQGSSGSNSTTQSGQTGATPKPGSGTSRRQVPDQPVGSTKGNGTNPRGHAGGDVDGKPGGSPDGWPNQRFEGTPQGSLWGVPGCGGDYVPPHWLAPWLQAATVLPQMVGAALEVAAGIGMLLAPEPTGVTKVAGVLLILHGIDSMTSAATGNKTWTSRIGAGAAHMAGAGDEESEWIGDIVDMVVPMGASFVGEIAAEANAASKMNSSLSSAAEAADLRPPALVAAEVSEPHISVTWEDVDDAWIRDTARAEIGGDAESGLPGRAEEIKQGMSQNLHPIADQKTTIGIGAAYADVSGGYEIRLAPSNDAKKIKGLLGQLAQPGEVQLPGIKKIDGLTINHGEQVVISSGGVFGVGATKPICLDCQAAAGAANVDTYTKLKPPKKVKQPSPKGRPRSRGGGGRKKKP